MALHDTDTFRTLHTLGEHLLCAGRYAAVGRIGLAIVPGGIATPEFGEDNRRIAVIGRQLVVKANGKERRAPLTTLRAAGEFAGVPVGAPSHVYKPVTPCLLDAPLRLGAQEFDRIVSWYTLADEALRRFSAESADEAPSEVTLWPEHFDVAIRAADVNYGGLAGDQVIDRPYLYVGPPASAVPGSPDGFWNAPFGAACTDEDIHNAADGVAFFRSGRLHAQELAAISPG